MSAILRRRAQASAAGTLRHQLVHRRLERADRRTARVDRADLPSGARRGALHHRHARRHSVRRPELGRGEQRGHRQPDDAGSDDGDLAHEDRIWPGLKTERLSLGGGSRGHHRTEEPGIGYEGTWHVLLTHGQDSEPPHARRGTDIDADASRDNSFCGNELRGYVPFRAPPVERACTSSTVARRAGRCRGLTTD